MKTLIERCFSKGGQTTDSKSLKVIEKTTISQKSEVYPKIIQEIHREFDIAGDKLYTEEDLLNYPSWCSNNGYSYDVHFGWNHSNGHRPNNSELIKLYIQSLQQKEWDIQIETEFEDEDDDEDYTDGGFFGRSKAIPKITSNCVKITKIL